jgi:hypothetical protein
MVASSSFAARVLSVAAEKNTWGSPTSTEAAERIRPGVYKDGDTASIGDGLETRAATMKNAGRYVFGELAADADPR